MLQGSYQRLLRARCAYIERHVLSWFLAPGLNKVLTLPHPQRESAFVAWCLNPNSAGRMGLESQVSRPQKDLKMS